MRVGFAVLPVPAARCDSGQLKWLGEDGDGGNQEGSHRLTNPPRGLAGAGALRKPSHRASCQTRGQARELRAGRGVMKKAPWGPLQGAGRGAAQWEPGPEMLTSTREMPG